MSTNIKVITSTAADQIADYTKNTAAYITDIRAKMPKAAFLSQHCKTLLESVLICIEGLDTANMDQSERDQVLGELRRMLSAINRGLGIHESSNTRQRTEDPQITIYEVCGRLETSLFPFAELANDKTMTQAMELIIKKKEALLNALNAIADLTQRNPRNFGTEEKYTSFLKALRSFGIAYSYDAEKKTSLFSEGEGQQSIWTNLAKPEQPNIVNLELPDKGFHFFLLPDDIRDKQDIELESAILNFNGAISTSAPYIHHTMQKMQEVKIFADLGVVCGSLAGLDQNNAVAWYQLASEMKGIIKAYTEKQEQTVRGSVAEQQVESTVQHLDNIRKSIEQLKGSDKNTHKILIDTITAFIVFRISLEGVTANSPLQKKYEELKRKIGSVLDTAELPRDVELLESMEEHLLAMSAAPELTVELLQSKLNILDLYKFNFNKKYLGEIVKSLLSYTKGKEKQFIEDYIMQLAAWYGSGGSLSTWEKEFVSPLNELLEAYQTPENDLGKLNAMAKLLLVHYFDFKGYIGRDTEFEVNKLADIAKVNKLADIVKQISEIHAIVPFPADKLVKINEAIQGILSVVPVTQDKMESLIQTLQKIYQEHANEIEAKLKEDIAQSKESRLSLNQQLIALKEKRERLSERLSAFEAKASPEKEEMQEAEQAYKQAEAEFSTAKAQLVAAAKNQKELQEQYQKAMKKLDDDIEAQKKECEGKSKEYSELAAVKRDYINSKRPLEEALERLTIELTQVEKEKDLMVASVALKSSEEKLGAAQQKLDVKIESIKKNENLLASLSDKTLPNEIVKSTVTAIDTIIAKHAYLKHDYSGIANLLGLRKQADKDLAAAFQKFKIAVQKEALTYKQFDEALQELKKGIEDSLANNPSKERQGTLNAFLNSLDRQNRHIDHARVEKFKETSLQHANLRATLQNESRLITNINRTLVQQRKDAETLTGSRDAALADKDKKQAAVEEAKNERDQYVAQTKSNSPFSNMSLDQLEAKKKALEGERSAKKSKIDQLGIHDGGIVRLEATKGELERIQRRIELLKQQQIELLSSPSQEMGVVHARHTVWLAEQAVVTAQSEAVRMRESLQNTQQERDALITQQPEIQAEVKRLESQLAALHQQEAALQAKLQKLTEIRSQEPAVNVSTVPIETVIDISPASQPAADVAEDNITEVDDSAKQSDLTVVTPVVELKKKEVIASKNQKSKTRVALIDESVSVSEDEIPRVTLLSGGTQESISDRNRDARSEHKALVGEALNAHGIFHSPKKDRQNIISRLLDKAHQNLATNIGHGQS